MTEIKLLNNMEVTEVCNMLDDFVLSAWCNDRLVTYTDTPKNGIGCFHSGELTSDCATLSEDRKTIFITSDTCKFGFSRSGIIRTEVKDQGDIRTFVIEYEHNKLEITVHLEIAA